MSSDKFLRPSMLPKLALCGHYRSESMAGAAADRGTAMDIAFRQHIGGDGIGLSDDDDVANVRWAVETAIALAGGHALEAREEKLRVEMCGMEGTADLLCEIAGWSADLKSGQIRNYREQQAAYALGFMDLFFVEEWTVYLLFCDERHVEALRFNREEAETLIRSVKAKARGDMPPEPNEYCGWCARRWGCPARREALGFAPSGEFTSDMLDSLNSVQLRDFSIRAGIVEKANERAREILLERTIKGEATPGVSRIDRKASLKIQALDIVSGVSPETMAKWAGKVSVETAKEAWSSGQAFPEDKVIPIPGSSYVRITPPKAVK